MNFNKNPGEMPEAEFQKMMSIAGEISLKSKAERNFDQSIVEKLSAMTQKGTTDILKLASIFETTAHLDGPIEAFLNFNKTAQYAALITFYSEKQSLIAAIMWHLKKATLPQLRKFLKLKDSDINDAELTHMLDEKLTKVAVMVTKLIEADELAEKEKTSCTCEHCVAKRAEKQADDPLGLEAIERAKKKQNHGMN